MSSSPPCFISCSHADSSTVLSMSCHLCRHQNISHLLCQLFSALPFGLPSLHDHLAVLVVRLGFAADLDQRLPSVLRQHAIELAKRIPVQPVPVLAYQSTSLHPPTWCTCNRNNFMMISFLFACSDC